MQAVWGPEINILNFIDAVSAARQILFTPEATITLAIVDSETRQASHFISALTDIYPRCPIIITTYEGAGLDIMPVPSDKIQVLTKPFTVSELIETAERCLSCTPTR